MRTKYELKNVKNVPAALKQRIYEDAQEREITMNDVVGEILSAHWNEPYALSGERNVKQQRGNQLLVWLPPKMLARIWAIAKQRSITESAVICSALADHYGLLYTPVRRRGAVHKRKKAKEVEAA
jgi:hypothetical protein